MAEKQFFELLSDEVPGTWEAYLNLVDILEKKGGLDPKTFQLVYIGIKASRGETHSVSVHAGFAKQAGATREEVRGAVLTTMMASGTSGISSCLAAALNGYDKA
jgi:alkylhydroperoxidase/carboxymuconolactone decarboxylase family protein YurZ